MTIYQRIQELAKIRKISIRQLEQTLNFSNGTIRKWKNTAPIGRLSQVADYFDVTVDYLLGKEENRNEKKPDLSQNQRLVATHIDDDTPEEERQQIINFIENLKKARGN